MASEGPGRAMNIRVVLGEDNVLVREGVRALLDASDGIEVAGVAADGGIVGSGFMEISLSGRTAIVTGGSKGIGLACAKGFLAEGARVAIASRSKVNLVAADRASGSSLPPWGSWPRLSCTATMPETDGAAGCADGSGELTGPRGLTRGSQR